jgi:hypothetical protein
MVFGAALNGEVNNALLLDLLLNNNSAVRWGFWSRTHDCFFPAFDASYRLFVVHFKYFDIFSYEILGFQMYTSNRQGFYIGRGTITLDRITLKNTKCNVSSIHSSAPTLFHLLTKTSKQISQLAIGLYIWYKNRTTIHIPIFG